MNATRPSGYAPRMATSRRTRIVIVVVALSTVVAAALVVWWRWPSEEKTAPPLARQYRDFTVCLLTDNAGVDGPLAQPMWAGIQDAALAGSVRSQYVSVAGEQTADNAATFLASLAQSECDLVFAAGTAPREAVRAKAATFPQIRFYAVSPGVSTANVSAVDGADVRASTARLVSSAIPPR